jgi:segregation and condensation protein B
MTDMENGDSTPTDADAAADSAGEGAADAVADTAADTVVDTAADTASPDTTSSEPAVGRASAELTAIVEALIFASPEPITPKMLFKLLADEPKEDVTAAVEALMAEYQQRAGLQFVEVAGGYQIVTRPELHEWVRRLFHERSTQKLTVQGLETLAVISYKQPITTAEISEIRGVNTSGVLSTLMERHLIKIVGRKNVVGRPFLYATTKEFLVRFGLKDLGDLPKIEDMADALGFDPPAAFFDEMPRDEMLPLGDPDPEPASDAGADVPADGASTPEAES